MPALLKAVTVDEKLPQHKLDNLVKRLDAGHANNIYCDIL
jgi:hypothetical protein